MDLKLTFKPRARFAALSMIAFMPEAQTLLTVVDGVDFGSPANKAACLAGACPRPACKTQLRKDGKLVKFHFSPFYFTTAKKVTKCFFVCILAKMKRLFLMFVCQE